MPLKCCVMGCHVRAERDNIKLYKFPLIQNKNQCLHDLSKRRQQAWLKAINRPELEFRQLKYYYVCAKHFTSGRSAKIKDELNPDWIPSLNLENVVKVKPKSLGKPTKRNKPACYLLEIEMQSPPSADMVNDEVKPEPAEEMSPQKNSEFLYQSEAHNMDAISDKEKRYVKDVRVLVAEIKKPGREFLYNPQSKDYRNNFLRENIWTQIAKTINMSKSKCQMMWKNMRRKYLQALVKQRTSEYYKFKPMTQLLLNEMDFLKEELEPRVNELITHESFASIDEPLSEEDSDTKAWWCSERPENELISPNLCAKQEEQTVETITDPLKRTNCNKLENDELEKSQIDDVDTYSGSESGIEPRAKKICRIANTVFYEESSNPDESEKSNLTKRLQLIENELSVMRESLVSFMSSVGKSTKKGDLFYQSLQQEVDKLPKEKQKKMKILLMKTVFNDP